MRDVRILEACASFGRGTPTGGQCNDAERENCVSMRKRQNLSDSDRLRVAFDPLTVEPEVPARDQGLCRRPRPGQPREKEKFVDPHVYRASAAKAAKRLPGAGVTGAARLAGR